MSGCCCCCWWWWWWWCWCDWFRSLRCWLRELTLPNSPDVWGKEPLWTSWSFATASRVSTLKQCMLQHTWKPPPSIYRTYRTGQLGTIILGLFVSSWGMGFAYVLVLWSSWVFPWIRLTRGINLNRIGVIACSVVLIFRRVMLMVIIMVSRLGRTSGNAYTWFVLGRFGVITLLAFLYFIPVIS